MKRLPIALFFCAGLLMVCSSFSTKTDVVNYLNTKDTLVYDNVTYKLAWSSHPADNYYKQEYVPVGETVKKFNSMLLIDFMVTQDSTVTLVGQKIAELRERKKTDYIANFQVRQNDSTREYLLDFVVSDADRSYAISRYASMVEWNAYHYKTYTDKQGHRGALLFGLSKRAYKNDILSFLKGLKEKRIDDLKLFIPHAMPDVEVK